MRDSLLVALIVVPFGTVLCACATLPSEAPALLVQLDANSRNQISRSVAEALGSSDVMLASDTLTRESTLIIERKPARDATGQRLSGRDYDKPERFELFKQGEACSLVHARTQKRYPLEGVRCEKLSR